VLAFAVLACLILYALNTGDFFFHDSAPVLVENSAVRISGSNLEQWRAAAMSTDTGPLGRPVSMLSFAANHVLSGEISPVAVKLTNVLLHALTGVFLWLFLAVVLEHSPVLALQRDQARMVASLAAALWLLHPLHVSTVMYAVQRMTQLAALFTLVGLWQLFRLRVRWLSDAPQAADYSRLLLVGLVWTALAALSKENGLLLPLLAAVTELCLFRFRTAAGPGPLIRWTVLAALGTTVIALIGLPLLATEYVQGWYLQRPFSLDERLLTQPRVLWHYIGWIFLPDITAMGFNHDDIRISRGLLDPLSTLLALIAFAGLAILAWWQRNRWPLLGFGLLWFFSAHALESSIFALEMTYEHRNYLPAAGPLLFLAGLPLLLSPERAGLARLGLALFLVALLPLLFLRSATWSSELRLVETNFRNHPQSAKTRFNLASTYYETALHTSDPRLVREYFTASRLAAVGLLEDDPAHIPALVWLILIDSSSADSSRVADWQTRLLLALEKPVLHASDVKFLMVLNDCVIVARCPAPASGQEAFLRDLVDRFPNRSHLRYELARYCQRSQRIECAREEAEQLIADYPGFLRALEILFLLDQQAGDGGRALETARRLLRADTQRRFTAGLLQPQGGEAP
jgi:hypothetical protein